MFISLTNYYATNIVWSYFENLRQLLVGHSFCGKTANFSNIEIGKFVCASILSFGRTLPECKSYFFSCPVSKTFSSICLREFTYCSQFRFPLQSESQWMLQHRDWQFIFKSNYTSIRKIKMNLWQSRKFRLMTYDTVVTLLLFFVGKYFSITIEDLKFAIIVLQPVVISVITGVVVEDYATKMSAPKG